MPQRQLRPSSAGRPYTKRSRSGLGTPLPPPLSLSATAAAAERRAIVTAAPLWSRCAGAARTRHWRQLTAAAEGWRGVERDANRRDGLHRHHRRCHRRGWCRSIASVAACRLLKDVRSGMFVDVCGSLMRPRRRIGFHLRCLETLGVMKAPVAVIEPGAGGRDVRRV